jgi:hypothetical protein
MSNFLDKLIKFVIVIFAIGIIVGLISLISLFL